MRILDIIEATTVDGPGFRVAVYFAGCGHNCPGCHNPQSHDFSGGYEINVAPLASRLLDSGMNVTLSGGDPVYQVEEVITLSNLLRAQGRTVWLYTGFTIEQLLALPSGRNRVAATDVIVDGPFVESLRDTSLQFRGSSNQRIIDCRATLAAGEPRLWHSSF